MNIHRIPEGAIQFYSDVEVSGEVRKWEAKHADMRIVETWEMSPSPTFDNDDSIVALFAKAVDVPQRGYPDFVFILFNKDK